jgi:hypothetical protein
MFLSKLVAKFETKKKKVGGKRVHLSTIQIPKINGILIYLVYVIGT